MQENIARSANLCEVDNTEIAQDVKYNLSFQTFSKYVFVMVLEVTVTLSYPQSYTDKSHSHSLLIPWRRKKLPALETYARLMPPKSHMTSFITYLSKAFRQHILVMVVAVTVTLLCP